MLASLIDEIREYWDATGRTCADVASFPAAVACSDTLGSSDVLIYPFRFWLIISIWISWISINLSPLVRQNMIELLVKMTRGRFDLHIARADHEDT